MQNDLRKQKEIAMASQSLKDKTVKGVVWSAIERLSVQILFFVITIVMARQLTPHDYGLIGLLAIFIEVSQALVDSGFGQALIRKQNRTDVDNCTMFYFNIVVSSFLYLCLWFLAPFVAKFYDAPLLCSVMRIVCLGIIFNSFSLVQRALLTIKLDFKTQMKSSLIAAVISGVIGIWMAYNGYGIWSIVAQQISNYAINTGLLWIVARWHPKWLYSWASFREMFGFGSKLVAASLLNTIYNNIYQIVIGKVFNPDSLGHYTRAKQFADFPSTNLSNIIQRVTFPVLCEMQNDDERLRAAYIKTLRMIAFIIFPIMCGLAGMAHPLIELLLGEKWLFAATLLSIICYSFMWNPIASLNLNLLQVKGRSDLFLKLEIIKKVWGVFILVVTVPFGLLVMCYSMLLSVVVGLFINTYYIGKFLDFGFVKHIKEVLPILIICLLMSAGLWGMQFLIINNIIYLFSSITIGILFYWAATKVIKIKEASELIAMVNQLRKKK